MQGESPYRVRAYREAARQIEQLTEDLGDLAAQGRLREIPGVGESLANKIDEYLKTGHVRAYDELRKDFPPSLAELLKVPGIGPSHAREFYRVLGIETLRGLEEAARDHKLRDLPGFGEKTEVNILKEINRLRERTRRLPIAVARPAAEKIVALLESHPAVQRIEPAGSLRRWQETIGDIDLLVGSDRPLEVMEAFVNLPHVKEVIAQGPTKTSILTNEDLQIDLRVVTPDFYGAALQHFTGSKAHNIVLRDLAIGKGLKINEYGVFDLKTGQILGGAREADVYRVMGMPWIPAELRENRGEIEAALHHALPHLMAEQDIRGDLHVHSDWSDGSATIEIMVEAAIQRGYEYIAIADHSRSLAIAHGLSVTRVYEQRQLIARLNRKYAPFRILAAIELDILKDGSLDFDDEVLRGFDIVTASVHSNFRQPRDAMTARIIRAMRNPLVKVLNHPTGRILGRREGYDVDVEQLLRVAAETHTAVEINSSPDRLDLGDVWARRAKELGVALVINSDAHSPADFENLRYGVATARRGWLTKEDVLNAQPLPKLLAILPRAKFAA